ncbi:peroxidase family protein [Phenylobacterium sp.]|uniref:peroxidase family protein n=1 Tax=Phenylobacterium sp. TaxID=1871053 RepID=UPI0025CDED70|nr:peroxidase family protein [Phenylobacterium sp.]
MATLDGLRHNMRWGNLFDTQRRDPPIPPGLPGQDVTKERTADGSYNDLEKPWMGMAGARFGRNMPIERTFGADAKALLTPNPREVSNKLLARQDFVPVPHLNLMAAGWLQFMVHDWVSHGTSPKDNPHLVPLPPGDDWPQNPMTILRSEPDKVDAADDGRPAAYANAETHWWDGSQIYGSSLERQRLIRTNPGETEMRTDGKLGLSASGNLPIISEIADKGDASGFKFPDQELAGVTGNWWICLSMFQTLFAREHNAIVDRLKVDHPDKSGEWLFQKARLVNAALLAKIHTTEWTPALMNSALGRTIMRTNWWGLAGEHFTRGFGRFDGSETFSGIPGSETDQHAAPYAMTEEFVASYRMHSLIPDDFSFRAAKDDREIRKTTMAEVSHGHVAQLYRDMSFDDIVYSMGTMHPGALVLHNFPNTLRKLAEDPAKNIFTDLAAVDILRDRERGVPRYCEFRRLMGMKAPRSFEELTTNPQWRKDIKELYPSVEDVDLLVGTLSESNGGTPVGFGFSDTVFRIFILMASRRLKSDRFYTRDFTPEVYTPGGFAWVADNDLRSVFERHCPALEPRYGDVRNMFFPWARGQA